MATDVQNSLLQGAAVLPDGNGGFTPCPALLTAEEATRFLRLDTLGRKSPRKSLQYLLELGLLRACRISGTNFYRREALEAFLREQEDRTGERRRRR
jgi:hypothetical protein